MGLKKINNDHPSLGIDKTRISLNEMFFDRISRPPASPTSTYLKFSAFTYDDISQTHTITFCITHISVAKAHLAPHQAIITDKSFTRILSETCNNSNITTA